MANTKMTKKQATDSLRSHYLDLIRTALETGGDEVLVTGSNEFAVPCVDGNGEEQFIVLTCKIPTGDRDGTPYDGYAMAEDYRMKCADKEAKKKEAERKKKEKMEKDAKARAENAAARAKAKEQREEA